MNVNTETTLRIATVQRSTNDLNAGDKYIVLRVDFRDEVAYCLGEVTETQGNCIRKHTGGKAIPLANVVIAGNVLRDAELLRILFRQAVRNARGEYEIRTTRGGNVYATLV